MADEAEERRLPAARGATASEETCQSSDRAHLEVRLSSAKSSHRQDSLRAKSSSKTPCDCREFLALSESLSGLRFKQSHHQKRTSSSNTVQLDWYAEKALDSKSESFSSSSSSSSAPADTAVVDESAAW